MNYLQNDALLSCALMGLTVCLIGASTVLICSLKGQARRKVMAGLTMSGWASYWLHNEVSCHDNV